MCATLGGLEALGQPTGPVSYTHLDVYKRQANDDGFIDREFELCNTGGQNRELSPKGIDKGAVSYTHLDVYKRQASGRSGPGCHRRAAAADA